MLESFLDYPVSRRGFLEAPAVAATLRNLLAPESSDNLTPFSGTEDRQRGFKLIKDVSFVLSNQLKSRFIPYSEFDQAQTLSDEALFEYISQHASGTEENKIGWQTKLAGTNLPLEVDLSYTEYGTVSNYCLITNIASSQIPEIAPLLNSKDEFKGEGEMRKALSTIFHLPPRMLVMLYSYLEKPTQLFLLGKDASIEHDKPTTELVFFPQGEFRLMVATPFQGRINFPTHP